MGSASAGLIAVTAVAAGAAQIAAFGSLMPGEWQLKEVGESTSRTVCLGDPGKILQIAHPGATCTRHVLDSTARAVTVHYTCPGAGHGRSTLTVRTSQSFKLETQGMAGGAPFAVDYDARRVGDCPGAAPAEPATNGGD